MLKGPSAIYLVAKRILDFFLGGILFVLSVPIILLAALAIRFETPGNPFFLQSRVGLGGRPFRIFKLRGMYQDAQKRFPDLYDYQRFKDLNFYFHYKQDPRVTSVGKFLRRTSIDELPNLLNVVNGTMSLVGPRPEIPEVLALYAERAIPYVSVKPGVTCLSKITGRDLLTKKESVDYDMAYVRDMSFSLDIKILWKTMRNVLSLQNVLPSRQESWVARQPEANERASAWRDTD